MVSEELSGKTRSLPSRHMIEQLVGIGCVRGSWSRSGCVRDVPMVAEDRVREVLVATGFCPGTAGRDLVWPGVIEMVSRIAGDCWSLPVRSRSGISTNTWWACFSVPGQTEQAGSGRWASRVWAPGTVHVWWA
jgi:hypothetical protein